MKGLSAVSFLIILIFFLSFSFKVFAADEERTYQGITYACTGVAESKEDPKWKTYPLKLMFTAGSRAYVSEVNVSIQDSTGKVVLKVQCDAPWLLAKLKPGTYSVSAQAEGAGTRSVKVTVPASGQFELAIRFPEIPVEKDYR